MMTDTVFQFDDWPSTLEHARELIGNAGPEYQVVATALQNLLARLAGGCFHLAVLGQFKRGKSTLLNALLGDAILPTSVVPLTAVPTWLRAGESPSAHFKFKDGSAREFPAQRTEELSALLTRYVTEEGNPGNTLGVTEATVRHPAPVLTKGVVLIDTPGIGSTSLHNTEATLGFLPQCDGAVFLVSADPPITQVEIEFLQQVQSHVPRLFFVLNKMDYLNLAERQQAAQFLRRNLKEHAGVDETTPIFGVSARLGLQARQAGDIEGWRESGLETVERHLIDFLARDKFHALQEAVRRKSLDIITEALLRLRLSLRSLQMPLQDLRSRLTAFDNWLIEMRQEQVAAQDRLVGDRRRAHEFLEEQYEHFKSKALQSLHAALAAETTRTGAGPLQESALQAVLEANIPVVFQREFQASTAIFHQRISEVLRLQEERADRLSDSVQKTAADLFEVSFTPQPHTYSFESGRTPYWLTYRWDQSFGLISPSLIDKLLSQSIRNRRLERRYREKVDSLVITNAGKLREALSDQIDAAFKRFARNLDERVTVALAATHGAIRAALTRREELSAATAKETRQLDQAVGELAQCLERLGGLKATALSDRKL